MDVLKVSPESERRSDRRRDWALIVVSLGGMTMTIFAGFAMWLLSGNAKYVFWLGALAMGQIALIFTGILGLLVKRRLSLSRTEFKISDFDPLSRHDAQEAVEEAVESLPAINDSTNKPS